ncbi:MAG: hypothetical protein FD143_3257 [Ignavibacteria bacterium]|nr:MAG: hypothetical protein FD143_3257 [Ignavibacteria bacterium]
MSGFFRTCVSEYIAQDVSGFSRTCVSEYSSVWFFQNHMTTIHFGFSRQALVHVIMNLGLHMIAQLKEKI